MIPFVPRKVAKALSSHKVSTISEPSSSSQRSAEPLVTTHAHKQDSVVPTRVLPSPQFDVKGKGKEVGSQQVYKDDEYVSLLCLSLSEYALWSDPDLRRSVETYEEGYVPLSYLTHQSSFLSTLESQPPEAALVKAIRTHAANTFEIRLLMSSPTRSAWYGKGPSPKDSLGGYEIRLKDWENTVRRAQNSSRNDWESKTLYIENVPPSYRSIHGILTFLRALLNCSETEDASSRVQNVSLPKHYLHNPGERPKCKGFALVTLSRPEDINFLLQQWPWERQPAKDHDGAADQSSVAQEASKFGFRVLKKSRWEQLNEEYLAYRQQLLDAIVQEQDAMAAVNIGSGSAVMETENAEEAQSIQSSSQLHPSAPFPPGCLVFLRNVHPETNKTTLRKLLGQAFGDRQGGGVEDPIDYVDFNKGMDTCYLRLALPHHTEILASHFSALPTVQEQGLDAVGARPCDSGRKPLAVEVVSGEREELYWGKIPEKLRRQAVEKALRGSQLEGGGTGQEGGDRLVGEVGTRKRRRRK